MDARSVLLLALLVSLAMKGQSPTDREKLDTAHKQFLGTKPCLGHAIDEYTHFDGMAVSPDGQQAFSIRWLDVLPGNSMVLTGIFTRAGRCVMSTGDYDTKGKKLIQQVLPDSLAINKKGQVAFIAFWTDESCTGCQMSGIFLEKEFKFSLNPFEAGSGKRSFTLNDDGTVIVRPGALPIPLPGSNPYQQHETAPVPATPKTDPVPDKAPPLVIPPSKPAAAKACSEAKPKKRIIGFDTKKLGDLAKRAGISIDAPEDKSKPCPAAPAK